MPDADGLLPTAHPKVFKATKMIPRSAKATQHPKPEFPEKAYTNDIFGAEAVALYMDPVVIYAFNTGDYEDLANVCNTESAYCRDTINSVKRMKETCEWFHFETPPKVQATGYNFVPETDNRDYSIHVESKISAYRYFEPNQMVVAKNESMKLTQYYNLRYIDGYWQVVAFKSEVSDVEKAAPDSRR